MKSIGSRNLQILELGIVVIAKNYNPSLLNVDFLKSSGLVPDDWHLTQEPVCTAEGSQVVFNNKVNIVALPNRITFIETLHDEVDGGIQVANLAKRYVESLPNLDYMAVGLNPKGHIAFKDRAEAENFVNTKLLISGAWQEIGKEPMRASLRLSYILERSKFYLSIDTGTSQIHGQEVSVHAVIFSGNFSYEVKATERQSKVQEVCQYLNSWHLDLESYRDLIQSRFLSLV